jgi:hypothetical protein
MDEIDVIRRAFGAADRDPDAQERARARLRDAMAAERPVVPTRPATLPTAPTVRVVTPSRPRLRPARWLGVAAALVAAVLVAQTVFSQHESGPSPDALARAHAHAVAVTALDGLAVAASAAQPGLIPPGKYAYLASIQTTPVPQPQKDSGLVGNGDVVTGKSFNLSVRRTVQTWVGADGKGLRITTTDGFSFATEGDRQAWIEMGQPTLPQPGTVDQEPFDLWGDLGLDPLTLPTDPSELLKALQQPINSRGSLDDATVMDGIATLLAEGNPSPALRAAMFKVLEDLPGIRSLGVVKDAWGRPGVGFVLPLGPREREIIVDQATSDVLASMYYAPALGGALRFTALYAPGTIVSHPHVVN